MRDETQLARKKSLYSAKKTILFQLGTAVLSLLLGLCLFYLVAHFLRIWNTQFADGDYIVDDGQVLFVSLVFLIIHIIRKQFEEGHTQNNVLFHSVKAGIYAGAIMACFWIVLLLQISPSLNMILLQVVYQITLYATLGLLIGLVQTVRLHLEQFDPKKHRYLLSNKASVAACKLGIYPYRQKVEIFKSSLNYFLPITFWVLIVYVTFSEDYPFPFALIFTGVLFAIIYRLGNKVSKALKPDIHSRTGQVRKKHIPGSKRTSEQFILMLRGFTYQTDSKIWHAVVESQEYKLWVSGASQSVLAIELPEKEIPTLDDKPLTIEI